MWCFNISQGKKIIIDACRVYKDGASISQRVRKFLLRVEGVLGWCFNISQGKKIIIDAFRGVLGLGFNISQGKNTIVDAYRVHLHRASISH